MRAPRRCSSSAISRPMRFAEPVISATFPSMFINKVAIITGASRGIGRAIAKKLYENGASIAHPEEVAGLVAFLPLKPAARLQARRSAFAADRRRHRRSRHLQ